MNLREEYLAKRKAMLEEAKKLINQGKLDEAKAKREEIESLDKDYEAKAKEEANLNSLEDKVAPINMDVQSVEGNKLNKVEEIKEVKNDLNYENVFSKVMLGHDLTNEEIAVFNKFNPTNLYTHTTENTEVVIPETTVDGIYDLMQEMHPVLADVAVTRIKGTVKYPIRTAIKSGDAAYYDEATLTADEENAFDELVLGGKELSKAVTVSWKLQSMAISDFIPFITRELAERMGATKAAAYVRGAGDAKNPMGVITALEKETKTPQKISSKEITYETLTGAMAKVRSNAVNGAKIYANNGVIWGVLANIKDTQGRPIFIPDVTANGVGRIFGVPVMEEDALKENEILIGNFRIGYKDNVQEAMKLVTETHAKARTTDFVAYEVHDSGVIDNKAFAYIKKDNAV